MNHTTLRVSRALVSAAMLASAACTDVTGTRSASLSPSALTAAFSTVPLGYGDLSSSFVGTPIENAGTGSLWIGGGRDAHFENGSLMGGGVHDAFLGAVRFGAFPRRGDDGPFGWRLRCLGTYDATTGRTTCATRTFRGFTLDRSVRFTDASGAAQQFFDSSTTDTVNVTTALSGTLKFEADGDDVHHRGWGMGRGLGGRLLGDTSTILSATTAVTAESDRTVGGLADGSTQRSVNGTSKATETTTGTSSKGDFTAARIVGDTTEGLVIPIPTSSDGPSFPTAGKVIRSMKVTLTYSGEAPVEASRREVITYDGTNTVKIEITMNGTTRNCTRTLPWGRVVCQ